MPTSWFRGPSSRKKRDRPVQNQIHADGLQRYIDLAIRILSLHLAVLLQLRRLNSIKNVDINEFFIALMRIRTHLFSAACQTKINGFKRLFWMLAF